MIPELFLRVIDGKLILWDYHQHAQYEISSAHLKRILELSSGLAPDDSAIDRELVDAGILEQRGEQNWGWDCLSRIFHIGTQITLKPGMALPHNDSYQGYLDYCESIADKIPELHIELPGAAISLPAPELQLIEQSSLWDNLLQRQTCRSFDRATVSLAQVATTLWASFGAVHGDSREDLAQVGLMPVGYRRTSPSGGSLQPSEAYLVAMQVDGLTQGIYHYRCHKHELSLVRDNFDISTLGPLLCAQNFANDLSFGIFITSRFDKMWWKYPHSRAYRVALFDIGCLVQTFQLVCTAQGLQSWPTGYFLDQEINQLLLLDKNKESVLFFLGGGIGSGCIAKEMVSLLESRSKVS